VPEVLARLLVLGVSAASGLDEARDARYLVGDFHLPQLVDLGLDVV
jgi:hypothetical protein